MDRSRAPLLLAGLAFAASGGAALIYEVSWQRMLVLHSGAGIYSVAMVVAAFLAGLGGGSLAGGLLSRRLSPLGSLLAFTLLEFLVGAFALASRWIFTDVLARWGAWIATQPWHAGASHFLALVFPTTLMGMSLPLLVRALVRDPSRAARRVGFLYAVNVLGAALGAFLTPWVLVPRYGIGGAVLVGAMGSGFAALGGLLAALSRQSMAVAAPQAAATARSEDPDAPGARPLALLAPLSALSGFCALSLEILWFRIASVTTKSTAFSFGTILALYLGGTGVGAAFGVAGIPRVKKPLRAFLTSQALLIAIAGAAVAGLAWLPPELPVYRWYLDYFARMEGFILGGRWETGAALRLYLLLPVWLLGLPTVLMGWSFVVLQRAVQDRAETGGFKVGMLQAANLVGCVAGSLLTGLVGLDVIGTPGAFRGLMLLGFLFAVVGGWLYDSLRFSVLGTLLAVGFMALPGRTEFWLRLHGDPAPSRNDFVEEGAGGVAVVRKGRWGAWQVRLAGRGVSLMPYGSMHSWLGAVPAAIHPAPREVAVVGLGSGNTAWAVGCQREIRKIDVFEISGPLERVLRRFAAAETPYGLRDFLADPRVRITIADGRNALARSPRRFDIIETDPLNPYDSYSGLVFSEEFYRICAARLARGGIMCAWSPTRHVAAAFAAAFPHVISMAGGQLLVGSLEPIAIDPPAWSRRLAPMSNCLWEDTAKEVAGLFAQARVLKPEELEDALPNRDLFPRDEFASRN